jgi:hypothetical protein
MTLAKSLHYTMYRKETIQVHCLMNVRFSSTDKINVLKVMYMDPC